MILSDLIAPLPRAVLTGSADCEVSGVQDDSRLLQPGDVFVVGGFPGHAVNVVDVGVNEETGHKYFILAQSYMPAQQNQILLNPATGDVFYELFDFMTEVVTPDWTFHVNDLRRWH